MRILSTSEQRYTTGLEAFLERENGFYYLGVTEGCRAGTVALTILDDKLISRNLIFPIVEPVKM